MQQLDQPVEVGARAQLRVQRAMVDDVVAVQAAGARAQHRRHVQVADAERVEVRQQRGRLHETEAGMQLQAVGGTRHTRGLQRHGGCAHAGSRATTADQGGRPIASSWDR